MGDTEISKIRLPLSEKIEGERIYLARPEVSFSFAGVLFANIDKSRHLLEPWLDWAPETKRPEDSYDFLTLCGDNWDKHKEFPYGVFLKDTHDFIGVVGTVEMAPAHYRTEIGYWLSGEYTGKGYMREAVKLLEEKLIESGFNRLVITTDVLNTKSASVAQACGYRLEAVLKQSEYAPHLKRFRDKNIFVKFVNKERFLYSEEMFT